MSSLRESYWNVANPRAEIYSRALTDSGLLGGAKNMNLDGSVTPIEFTAAPDAGKMLYITSMALSISDKGTPKEDEYGNINSALAVGIRFFADINGSRTFFDTTLKTNADLIAAGSRFDVNEFKNNNRILTYYSDFFTTSGDIILNSTGNDKFGAQINDDLTGLTFHGVRIRGRTVVSVGA